MTRADARLRLARVTEAHTCLSVACPHGRPGYFAIAGSPWGSACTAGFFFRRRAVNLSM